MSPSESWVDPRLEVRFSRVHGKGVFAREAIRRGERLAVFGGAVMWIDELLELPEPLQDFPMQIEERFVLGTRNRDQPETADFFNHSCDPNTGFRGQIFLVALRPIEAGEECEVPEKFKARQWLDLFRDESFQLLQRAIQAGIEQRRRA